MARFDKKTIPKDIFFDGRMNIQWKDGSHTAYDYYRLRCSCPCAKCVDEVTGEKILVDSQVDLNVKPLESFYVGNYAIQIKWSDNHETGIFSFKMLRESIPHEEITS